MSSKQIIALAITSLLLVMAHAQTETTEPASEPVRLDEQYGDAFVNYKPYLTPKPVPKPSAMKPAAKAPEAKEKVTVEWLRKNYPVLEDRAINNPTQENVEAQLYAKRIILDKAQQYSDVVQKISTQDPLLNENNRVPTASGGALSVRNADFRAQDQAVRELAQLGGLVVFIDGHCRFCAMQLPIVEGLKKTLGMEYLVISIDGSVPKDFKGSFKVDNGLYQKVGLKLTPSIVYIPSPKAYQNGSDPNRYFIVAQGFYPLDQLGKQVAFAGHDSQLLSAQTMQDLSVWQRGVASNNDLQTLELDVNNPASFKQTLQPILLKQYK